jgi:chemotaxis protein methyltransferase CheR
MQQMSDVDCVSFLQWALPRMRLRWQGFRKVRNQVCKRIKKRIRLLGLADFSEYKIFLENYPQKWRELEALCYISISRFYRDKNVFQIISSQIIPDLVKKTLNRGEKRISCWSAGCCSGEEPYTLHIIWKMEVEPELAPSISISILATDINDNLLHRAKRGLYQPGSLKHLPDNMRDKAFEISGDFFVLKAEYRQNINFLRQDIRIEMPKGPFHIILCRNLVFTYFDVELQNEILNKILEKLLPNGFLIIGTHEVVPFEGRRLKKFRNTPNIFQKQGD